ncbi:MAG: PAS domain S-box protein [Candidatus Moranbacteria bacterium]|nr:PAS domain S-box protein [Candidatus Moranbacteria bacterium]
MLNTFRRRLSLLVILMAIVPVCVLIFFVFTSMRNTFLDQQRNSVLLSLSRDVNFFEQDFKQTPSDFSDQSFWSEYFVKNDLVSGRFLVNENGSVLFGGDHLVQDFSFDKNFFLTDFSRHISVDSSYIGFFERDNVHYFFHRIFVPGDIPESFVVVFEPVLTSDLLTGYYSLRNTLLSGGALLLVLLFIIGFLFFRRLSEHAVSFVELIRSVENGDYSQPVPAFLLSAPGDFGVLARAFQSMRDKLHLAHDSLRSDVDRKTRALQMSLEHARQDNHALSVSRTALATALEDVREERDRSKMLLQESQKFRMAVDAASDHIVIADADSVILYANPAAERITGFLFEEMRGKKMEDSSLWDGLMEDSFYEDLWKTVRDRKEAFVAEVRNRRKNGEEYYSAVSISPVLGDGGKIVFFVSVERDITEQKMIDQSKTEFMSLASHQLRTPLSTVRWYLELILGGDAGRVTKQQKMYLEELVVANHRMIELVGALLNVSRLELGTFRVDPQSVVVPDVVRDVFRELRSEIVMKKLVVEEQYHAKNFAMLADRNLFHVVFQNLLSNAVKYTPVDGSVSFASEFVSSHKSLRGQKFDVDTVVFSVTDTGCGIPSDQQDRVFSKLFRADNARSVDPDGNGLGLYVVKSVVESVGGRIWFESIEGKGATFYVSFASSGMKSRDGSRDLVV